MTKIQQWDVMVLGGGLAGLTLALQLKRARPSIKLLVLEKRAHPVEEAAFKVGESLVELGAYYLAQTLGLIEHIQSRQLPKYGLRFFFSGPQMGSLAGGLEMGVSSFFNTPSYQLDRGRFENHLGHVLRELGVDFLDGASVSDIQLGKAGAWHHVRYFHNGEARVSAARWLVDASGRAALIKRRLGLKQRVSHNINAAWFRIAERIRIDDWCPDGEWGGDGGSEPLRWLSTNHLMGRGYWVWIIPLASGSTSFGIVADPRLHNPRTFNRFDRALDWLKTHEPICARFVEANRAKLQDFLALKHFSHGSKQVFSGDRWALTGEAGVFLDPFYSPGSDFIAISNSLICELICQEMKGKDIRGLANIYEKIYLSYFENTLKVYQDQYPLFGNMQVMPLKIVWDYALYWSFLAFIFINGRIADLRAFMGIRADVERVLHLNERMQGFFRRWDELSRKELEGVFLDQGKVEVLRHLNGALTDGLSDEEFKTRFRENINRLDQISEEIIGRAAAKHPELSALLPAEGALPPTNHLAEVFAQLQL